MTHGDTHGRDASVLLFMSTSCVTAGIIVSHQLTKDSKIHVTLPSYVVFFLLSVLLVSVTVMMLFMYCKRDDKTVVVYVPENRGHHDTTTLQKAKDKFPIIGLYIFGTGNVLLDVLTIIFDISCSYVAVGHDVLAPHTWHLDVFLSWKHFVSSVVFHVSKIVFFVIQMAFLLQFSSAKFLRPMTTRLMIAMSVCANCAVWVVNYLQEIEEVKKAFGDVATKYGAASGEKSANYNDCLNMNTTLGRALDDAAKYLYAFVMEYSLVAIGILYHLWTTARADDTNRPHAENPNAITGEGATDCPNEHVHGVSNVRSREGVYSNQLEQSPYNPGIGERENVMHDEEESFAGNGDRLRPANERIVNNDENDGHTHVDFVPTENSPLLVRSAGRSHTGQPVHNQIGISFNIGFVFILLHFVIECLLGIFDNENGLTEDFDIFLFIHYGIEIAFRLVLILVIVKCLVIIRKIGITERPYTEEDFFLLLSSSGALMFEILTAIAGWNTIADGRATKQHLRVDDIKITVRLTWIVTFNALTNIVQIVLQNLIIIWIVRFSSSTHGLINGDRKFLFNGIVFLLVSNLAMWALESFVEIHTIDLFPLQHTYFGNSWNVIRIITYPVAVFYRFHSVGELFKNIP